VYKVVAHGAFTLIQQPFALNPDHLNVVEGKAAFTPLPRLQTGCLGLFFAFGFCIGALMIFATLREWQTLQQFQTTGVDTQAQIVERYSGNFRGIKNYFFRVRFENNGHIYENRVEVNVVQYTRYQVGEEIPLRYLPTDPNVLSIEWNGTQDTSFQRILTGFTLVWNGTLIAFLLFILWEYRMLLRLTLGGRLLTGEIIVASGCVDEHANYKVTIQYKFRSPAGVMLKGQASQTRGDLQKGLPRRGAPVAVYYRDDRTYMVL
jgi:hypothetical protein